MPECTCQQISDMLQGYLDVVMETIIDAIAAAHPEADVDESKGKKKPSGDRKKNPWNEFVKTCAPEGKTLKQCGVEYRAKKAATGG